MWQWEELKHAVLGVIVLCNKFRALQGVINQANLSKKCSKSDRLGWKHCTNVVAKMKMKISQSTVLLHCCCGGGGGGGGGGEYSLPTPFC